MSTIRAMALLTGMLTVAGCAKDKRIPVTLRADASETYSSCVVTFRAASETPERGDIPIVWRWTVNGKRVEGASGNAYLFSAISETPADYEIGVSVSAKGYYGEQTLSIKVNPPLFSPVGQVDRFFPDFPAIPRGNDSLLDPGGVVMVAGEYHAFYNAINENAGFYNGYAVSRDGVAWDKKRDSSRPLLDLEAFSACVGYRPVNLHVTSATFDEGSWCVWFTAVRDSSYFYGDVYRAFVPDLGGKPRYDPEPIVTGGVGLPRVIDCPDGERRLYFCSRTGTLGMARSFQGSRFIRDKDLAAGMLYPAIARGDRGWVLASEDTAWISKDGLDWHRVAEPLISARERETRGMSQLWIGSLLYNSGRFEYYVEGGSSTGGSNAYLVRWAE